MTDTTSLRSPRYAQIKSAAIEAFADGRTPSQRDLAEIVAGETGLDADGIARHLTPLLRRMEEKCEYVPQRAASGSKGAGMVGGELTSPLAFNWSSIAIADATLRSVAEVYLTAPGDQVPESAKHAFRTAIRCVEELPVRCSDAVMLAACARVGCERMHGYADEAYRRLTALPSAIAAKTAKNHRAALRAAVRYAAQHDAIPLLFPTNWPSDEWEAAKDRHFPLAEAGKTAALVLARRGAWTAFADTCRAMFDDTVTPESLTASQAEAAITHMQNVEGRIAAGYNARGALKEIAMLSGEGPFVGMRDAGEFTQETPAGRRSALYLYDDEGGAASGDWEGFCALLEQRGLPASLLSFLRWYEQWVTLESLVILRQPALYPARRDSVKLDTATLEGRMHALRAFLGAAINLLHIEPSTLSPDAVFGSEFASLLGSMTDWWERRRETLAPAALGAGKAGAIRQHVIAVGQMALAYYEYLRHRRGERVRIATTTDAETRDRRDRLDWRGEEAAAKTPVESMVWDSYRMASQYADAMAGLVRGEQGSRSQRPNEFKDLERIIRLTPPTFWIGLLDRMIEHVRAAKRAGRDHGWGYHLLVLDAFTLGMYISTGARNSELLHVRLDIQFSEVDRQRRQIRLRARDRKNKKPHTVLIQPSFVPDDLLSEYLDRTRPYFMRELHIERGRPSAVCDHPFLLVSARGTAYGCTKEKGDGTGRDKRAVRTRARQHSQRFKTHMAKAVVAAGLALPGQRYEFGLHALRGSCGYAVYHQLGLVAAADYLGDTIDTVEQAYSRKSGLLVDSSCLRGLDMRPKLTLTRAGGSARAGKEADVASRVRALLLDFDARPGDMHLDRALRDLLGEPAA